MNAEIVLSFNVYNLMQNTENEKHKTTVLILSIIPEVTLIEEDGEPGCSF